MQSKKSVANLALWNGATNGGVTIDDFEEFLRLGKEAFDAKYKEGSNG